MRFIPLDALEISEVIANPGCSICETLTCGSILYDTHDEKMRFERDFVDIVGIAELVSKNGDKKTKVHFILRHSHVTGSSKKIHLHFAIMLTT